MKKRCVGFLLACVLLLGMLPAVTANAASLSAAPYLNVNYSEASTTPVGTIRYVSQLTFSPNFHARYWGDYVDAAGYECYTADISMALSAIGLNATPAVLGDYWNAQGYTGGYPFTTMAWDVGAFGATFLQRTFAVAMENFLSNPHSYSPPIIHLTTYSARGHYVMVAGKLSATTYLVVDPAHDGGWTIQISNNVATYTRNGEERTEELEKTTQYFRSGNPTYQPTAPVTPTPTPAASTASDGFHQDGSVCASAALVDVPAESNWAHAGIDYCVSSRLMQGTDTTHFKPKEEMTRGMLVTVLYRAAGSPAVNDAAVPFTDLTAKWYQKAVIWAYQTGVTSGVSSDCFDPAGTVTREQLVCMLYRFRQLTDTTPARLDALDGISDADSISRWAQEAMRWAVTNGIISGTGSATLQPGGSATRAQMASILMRYQSL